MVGSKDDFRVRVAAAVEQLGLREVASRLDVRTESVMRIMTGQPTRRVTETLARVNAHRLDGEVRAS